MNIIHRKESILLFIGDIIVLLVSLVLTLIIRYGSFPSINIIKLHLIPFSILFIAFLLINFISGLYEKHTLLFKNRLPARLLNVQLVNAVLGIAFFYFVPYFSITPKFTLFIYLVLSLALMSIWRIFISPKLEPKKSQRALLIGDSREAEDLYEEINNNSRYHLMFAGIIRPSFDIAKTLNEITNFIEKNKCSIVVIDTRNTQISEIISNLYKYSLSGILFIDLSKMYESIFDRIPLSLMGKAWFIENMSSVAPKKIYDTVKRLIDIFIASIVGIISLILYPFIIIALKIEDRKNVIFTYQPRIGQNNKIINIVKFRTMKIANDNGNASDNRVTNVGLFLRKSRIDELPQLWNVIKGDISIIGPRPELPNYVKKYSEEIPYYSMRHIIKPGLSGWAQIYHEQHPHHAVNIEETSNKLSYDLYYIKHRSFILDLKIALKTIKVLITFVGR